LTLLVGLQKWHLASEFSHQQTPEVLWKTYRDPAQPRVISRKYITVKQKPKLVAQVEACFSKSTPG